MSNPFERLKDIANAEVGPKVTEKVLGSEEGAKTAGASPETKADIIDLSAVEARIKDTADVDPKLLAMLPELLTALTQGEAEIASGKAYAILNTPKGYWDLEWENGTRPLAQAISGANQKGLKIIHQGEKIVLTTEAEAQGRYVGRKPFE